jgi:hypothetical protein
LFQEAGDSNAQIEAHRKMTPAQNPCRPNLAQKPT